MQLTAIIEREDEAFVALCPELDIASQGGTVEEARQNLQEAVELFFESRIGGDYTAAALGGLRHTAGCLCCLSCAFSLGEPYAGYCMSADSEKFGRGEVTSPCSVRSKTTTTVIVPDHREVRVGTLLSIIRQSGLPRTLFEVN